MQKNTYKSKAELRVRWSECDMQGIAFNAIYMVWSEIAFQEHFRSLNLNIYELGKENIFDTVIVHSNIDYKLAARLDETLDIYSKVKKIGASSFIMEFEIKNQKLYQKILEKYYLDFLPKGNLNSPCSHITKNWHAINIELYVPTTNPISST